jgi:predicted amidohydrolase YtcJ
MSLGGAQVTVEQKPSLIILGRILTMDPPGARAEAAAIADGRFVSVGSREVVAAFPDAEVADFGERLITPGLIDAHNHLSGAALLPMWVDCSRLGSSEDLGTALARWKNDPGGDGWVRGYGWNPGPGGLALTRHELDEFMPGRPVVVAHFSFHGAVVNSVALEQLGITRSTPDPPGGRIIRDSTGEPNGVLMEQAWREDHLRSMEQYSDERWAELIAARVKTLHSHGVTAVHDAACPPEAEAVYNALEQAGRLEVSVVVMPHTRERPDHSLGARLEGPMSGEGSEALRAGAAKFYADGVNPEGDGGDDPSERGKGFVAPGARASALEAAEQGFRLAVHAMFNKGVEAALDVFEEVMKRQPQLDHRFRIEHAGVVSEEQMRKMADMGVIASVQPCFIEDTADFDFEPDRPPVYPFRTLLDKGIMLAGGTDDPANTVDSLSLLWGSSLGTTRRNSRGRVLFPDESVPFEKWLEAFTIGAAYAGGQEGERGSISPGKVADFVVLDGELDALNLPRVRETWRSGGRVYARS